MSKMNFDVLKNAEDDIIEKLIPFSSDDEKTKKRLFEMSEKKLNMRMNEIENNNETDTEITVSGVEKYKRPVWHKPLCAAAALAIIVGGIGAVGFMNKGVRTGKDQAAEVEEVVTDAITEPITEETTDASGVLSEDEMKAIFEENLPVFMEIHNLNATDVIDTNSDKVSFWQYGGEDPDGVFDQSLWPDSKKEGTEIFDHVTYYKVNDERYSNLDEFYDYYDQYFAYAQEDLGLDGHYITAIDLTGHNEDDKITDANSEIYRFNMIGYNDSIYVPLGINASVHPENWDNIVSDRSYFAKENKFVWERVNKNESAEEPYLEYLDLEFTKCSDGKWRISGESLVNCVYDETKDCSQNEIPLLYEFDGYSDNVTETTEE